MGMFDDIVYEAPCPICSRPLMGWQSKDAGCSLEKLTPGQLWQQSRLTRQGRAEHSERLHAAYTEFYCDCEDCGTWVEIRLSSGHLKYTSDDYRKMLTREPVEHRRGPIIPGGGV